MKAKVFGAALSPIEKRAMEIEIQKQLAEYDRKNILEIDAIVLWVLHETFGFGEKRLKKFFDNFIPAINDLVKRYEMGQADEAWLCTCKLKQCGIDISKWEYEK